MSKPEVRERLRQVLSAALSRQFEFGHVPRAVTDAVMAWHLDIVDKATIAAYSEGYDAGSSGACPPPDAA